MYEYILQIEYSTSEHHLLPSVPLIPLIPYYPFILSTKRVFGEPHATTCNDLIDLAPGPTTSHSRLQSDAEVLLHPNRRPTHHHPVSRSDPAGPSLLTHNEMGLLVMSLEDPGLPG